MGFIYQVGGIFAEAIRLIMIQILLSDEGQKLDPLVSLYYYAPVCTLMNFIVALVTEVPSFQMEDFWRVGVLIFVLNASVAFALNVASVFLVRSFHAIYMNHSSYLLAIFSYPFRYRFLSWAIKLTNLLDWEDIRPSHDFMWCIKEHPPSLCLYSNLGDCGYWAPSLRVWYCADGSGVLWGGLRRAYCILHVHEILRNRIMGRG
jgi:hypothetical protein